MKEIRRVTETLKRAKNIALSSQYDEAVNPEEYEAHVNRYDRREKLSSHLVNTVLKNHVPFMNEKGEPSQVLDLAAGTGFVSRALNQAGYTVTACDLSKNALAYLQSKNPDIATLVIDINEQLPFEDNQFTGVTTLWANRFIKDASSFSREVYRVLSPRGAFIWPIFTSEIPLWKKKSWLLQPTTPHALTELLEHVGFSVTAQKAPLREFLFTEQIPPHNIPTYLIAQKGVVTEKPQLLTPVFSPSLG